MVAYSSQAGLDSSSSCLDSSFAVAFDSSLAADLGSSALAVDSENRSYSLDWVCLSWLVVGVELRVAVGPWAVFEEARTKLLVAVALDLVADLVTCWTFAELNQLDWAVVLAGA